MFKFFDRFKKPSGDKKNIRLQAILKEKYATFQNLLSKNNLVLSLMADIEEKYSGEFLFDRQYLEIKTREVSDGVYGIIKDLNTLSYEKYQHLYKVHGDIKSEIDAILASKTAIPESNLTIPLDAVSGGMSNISGAKIAQLGEIRNRLSLPTPDGFSITTYAFKKFMEHNGLTEKINALLSSISIENQEALNSISSGIQKMVIDAEIPPDMEEAILSEVEALRKKTEDAEGGSLRLSVRSSAVEEDGHFSFAGQYSTFLNVPSGAVLDKYKEVVSSLFSSRAIFYYKTKGFSEEDMVMAVGVLRMIEAKAGGVMYSKDPNNPAGDTIIINAVCGLGMPVVDGTEEPDSYTVSGRDGSIIDKKIPIKNTMLACTPEGEIKAIPVPDHLKEKPCLSDEHISALINHARTLESHYGLPQDIEWAIDGKERIYILQSRPLRTMSDLKAAQSIPRRVEGYKILLEKGVIACKGIGAGAAFVIRDDEELKDFPEGAVLVARHTSTKYVAVMGKASAIVTDVGGATGHMASLTREYRIPTILNAERATSVIRHGQEITVDAINCNVYEGRVEELLKYASDKEEPFKNTKIFMTLEKVLKWIVPLNLIDPKRDNFNPEGCRTYHDITRFAHEIAMAVIFRTSKGHDITTFDDLMTAVTYAESGEYIGSPTVSLRAGIPVDAQIIDIEGGIKGSPRKALPEDIISIPFSAFLKGMTSMRWPGPPPVDAKGFMGMLAHTATIPEQQLYEMGEKSFAIISEHYMNFSIRLGYHFSMVEAYAGDNMNDNYIKFFFKGGGAARDRRLRRVRLITEIIKKLDFKVSVTEDVINASVTKYERQSIEEKLTVMGKLTAYTKQLDMVMYNDAITNWYVEEFVREHIKGLK